MIFEKVKKLIAKELDVSESKITMETCLSEDLGADSLDAVELVMALEDEFEIAVSDDDAQNLNTVKAIVEYIEKNAK
ncbi:MAG TPA: acyl carrier protein [Acholeplasmataceae bacterium]|nr:acyl carrier protein [Acholeplasmataceae bacterium]